MLLRVARPGWRFYHPKFSENAREHVSRGGHAVLRDPDTWTLWMPSDQGTITELSAWSLLDLSLPGFDEASESATVATVSLPRDTWETVERWCERDSVYPESTVEESLDCRACAMCCRDNTVLLEDSDITRWRAENRPDLFCDASLRRVGERLALRVLPSGDCVHLEGNDCGIYALRPSNCEAFPPGSECCLSAREA